MFEERPWGMRLMWWDIPSIVVCAVVTGLLWPLLGSMALFMPMVLGHFVLFCNIFRIRRSLELIWAVLFIVNSAASLEVLGMEAMGVIFLIQLPMTALLIGYEMRSWRYHGVMADRINPELERYLEWSRGRFARDGGQPRRGE